VSSAWSLRLVLVHLFVTAALAGLIWTIQLVHYPLFDYVERSRFVGFEQAHSARISYIVGPLMGVEFLCALLIVWQRPKAIPMWLVIAAFVALMVVHATTVLFSVPAHTILGQRYDAGAHHRLVQTNWIRTIGWTARAGLSAYMVSLVATVSAQSN
jgi:hypothetical protein